MNRPSMSPAAAGKKSVELTINCETGEVKGEAHNYQGEGCSLDLSQLLAGAEIKKRTPKIPRQQQAIGNKQGT